VKSGRLILVEHLQRLMKAKGWLRPNGRWNITALHEKVKGSRRWLYKVVYGQTDFGIDEYERILQRGFGQSLESLLTGMNLSPVPRDVEELQGDLRDAIRHAKETGTFEAFRYALKRVIIYLPNRDRI
jgi:hypothetical protein